jgi:uncharacterized repeat protein (TIGR03803 family)
MWFRLQVATGIYLAGVGGRAWVRGSHSPIGASANFHGTSRLHCCAQCRLAYGREGKPLRHHLQRRRNACGGTGCGTVFKVDPTTGEDTVLHSFTGHADGAHPNAGLIMDGKGNLYGPTAGSGADGYGTVFKVSGKGEFAVLYSFSGPDGAGPGDRFDFRREDGKPLWHQHRRRR